MDSMEFSWYFDKKYQSSRFYFSFPHSVWKLNAVETPILSEIHQEIDDGNVEVMMVLM